MAKRRRKKPVDKQVVNTQVEEAAVSTVPKFEIGVKGDEFDVKFTRAAAAKTAGADNLLRNLSKETRLSTYNFWNFAVLVLIFLLMTMSFALLSRGGDAPDFSTQALSDGSYAAELSKYYKDTLPFGRVLRTLGAYLGFGDMPEPKAEEPPEDPLPPDAPAVTQPTAVTTAPTTSGAPTSAPITELTEMTVPDTYIMYATATVNVRARPDFDSMIMGYFNKNEEVEVIEIGSDGWAKIWYNGMPAYVSADYLKEKKVVTTRETRHTTEATEETTEETDEITSVSDVTEDVTTTPEETAAEETTTVTEYTGFTGYGPGWTETAPPTPPPPPTTTPPETSSPTPTTTPPETDPPSPTTTTPETEPPTPTTTAPETEPPPPPPVQEESQDS